MYKLVVLDIDGTLLTNDEKITKKNYEAIQKSINMGVPVCICTGRNIHNTRRIIKKLKLETPYVCVDGMVVYNPKENNFIKDDALEQEALKEIITEIDKEYLYMEMCTHNNYIKYVKTKELGQYNYGGMPKNGKQWLRDYFKRGARYVKNVNKYKKDGGNISQLLFAGDVKTVDKVKKIIESKGYNNIELKDDLWENYCFVAPKNSRKIDGVKILCEHYNIKLEEVMAVGDQMNDYDMIKGVGMGVAMGNAEEKLKDVSSFITKDNENSGVACAIERFILNGK